MLTCRWAPGLLLLDAGDCRYRPEVADVWALGVMLYIMLAGTYPFETREDATMGDRVQRMIHKIHNVQYSAPAHLSDDCKNLLAQILVRLLLHRLLLCYSSHRLTSPGYLQTYI